MSDVTTNALKLLDDPNVTSDEIADLLARDGSIAAETLKIANSAIFSHQKKIETLKQAVGLVGLSAIKGILIAAAVRGIPNCGGNLHKLVWESSIGTGIAASLIARRLGKPYHDELFILGILHNLGQLVLLSNREVATVYQDVFQTIGEEEIDLNDAEQKVLGFSHFRAGSLVANIWSFPPALCVTIASFGGLSTCTHDSIMEKSKLVVFANQFSFASEIGRPEGHPIDRNALHAEAVEHGFNADSLQDDLDQLTEDVLSRFEIDRSLFGV